MMPRKRRAKQPASPTGEAQSVAQQVAEAFDLPTADMLPDPALATFTERVAPIGHNQPKTLPPYENKTVKPFIGRMGSGRGAVSRADDTSFSIESDHAQPAWKIALAQRNGYDDYSKDEGGTMLVADKEEMRKVGGDPNWVTRAFINAEPGQSR